MPHSAVQLKLDRSGGVTAFCGATEIGQGSDDVLVACVAEVLGIDPFDIRPVTGDTDLDAGGSGLLLEPRDVDDGQRRHPGRGAGARCAGRCRQPQARRPAQPPGLCRTPRVRLRGSGQGHVVPRCGLRGGSDVRRGRHGRLVHAAAERGALQGRRASDPRPPTPTPPRSSRSRSTNRPDGSACREYGSLTTSAARSIPTLVRGQIEGSVYMGVGEALMEEQVYRRLPPRLSNALVHKCPSMLEYKSLDVARHAGGRSPSWSRIPIPTDRLARKRSDRDRCCR